MPCKFPISTVPIIVRACGYKSGGISALVIMKKRFVVGDPPLDLCAKPVTDYCDAAQWTQAIQNCYVKIASTLVGLKSDTQFSERKSPYLCQTPFITDGQKLIEFKDFSFSRSGLDVDFWECLMDFPHEFRFAYLNCAGDLFGFYNFNLKISSIIEDAKSGLTYFSGSVSYPGWQLEKPLTIPSVIIGLLLNYANFDCATEQFVTDYQNVCV